MEKREIKFRVWSGEQMVSPDYITRDGFGFWKENSIHTCSDKIMQFTGLHDKHGKPIYEGDKSKCRLHGFDAHVEEVTTEVYYDLTVGAFLHKVISEGSDYTLFGLNSKNLLSCEVIGNIWES